MVAPKARLDRDDVLRTGDLVSAYRVDALLGTGGMGHVYRAHHELTARSVALKVLRLDQLELDHSVDRMMREATILASVEHAGIPQLFECGLLPDRRPWIAMELVAGTPLATVMESGPIDARDVRAFVRAVASVLSAAHARGVTHRDLKPDNIFLTPGCPAHGVRVIDWGIAHHRAGERYTAFNEAIGTPTYMSPEQARGAQADGYCDVYGLGVVAYHALVGKPPFVGASSIEVLVQHLNRPPPALGPRAPDAPFALVELVEAMLAKKPEARPSAEAVVAALDALALQADPQSYASQCADRTAPVPREVDDSRGARTVPIHVKGSKS
jgi:serine/threonine-protein kinase